MQKQTLSLESLADARHLGGYPAADGRRIRDKVLLRSGALFAASQNDIERLIKEYDLTTVIDLRTAQEAEEKPDPVIPGVTYHAIPVMSEASEHQNSIIEIYRKFPNDLGRVYVEMARNGALADNMYTSFFFSAESIAAYRRFFDILLQQKKGSVLWHCTGGKDRAGLASVLVLSVLGVDAQTVLDDFALTNLSNQNRINAVVSAAKAYTDDVSELEAVASLAGVSVPRMQKVFDLAEGESGSMLAFLQKKLGLSDDEVTQLREMYLEPWEELA